MQITVVGNIPEEEVQRYVEMSKEKYKNTVIKKIVLTEDGEFVNIEVEYGGVPFQRIRRITGYLVGTLDRFNNSKTAEVKDRVKHMYKAYYTKPTHYATKIQAEFTQTQPTEYSQQRGRKHEDNA